MSYITHRSQGIVISHTPYGASDRIVTLLTQDHGVIKVRVQNARGIESRLRYGTQFLTHGLFEYIRARDTWRLIGVHAIENTSLGSDDIKHVAPLCRDLDYFIVGEDPCPEIYGALYTLLFTSHNNFAHQVLVTRLSILSDLGYIEYEPYGLAQDLSKAHAAIAQAYQVAQLS
ncbi:recombination protein O N-terminal domain-containing protein [Candidatus Nomurabacteria bacterium]|nr:recombination protein O N-terminal domain-containing protein [Candidatus Nomurabacteria bacterium]